MTIVPFNAEKANNGYRNLYDETSNPGMSIFSGEKYQTGYGLGAIFGNILKAALPVVKQGVKSLGKTAIKAGMSIAKDKLSGRSFKDSISNNLKQAKREVLTNAIDFVTNKPPANKKRKRAKQSVTLPIPSKRKRRSKAGKDIFS